MKFNIFNLNYKISPLRKKLQKKTGSWQLELLLIGFLNQDHESIEHLKKLKKIGVLDTHPADSLQYWTCLVEKIDVYLTLDAKFKNAVNNYRNKFEVEILFPSDFCKRFDIRERLPMPYNYGEIFDAFGRRVDPE